MSELTKILNTDCRCDECCLGFRCLRALLDNETLTLLPAHDAEIRERAQREQYERDCEANCFYCRVGCPIEERPKESDFARFHHLHTVAGCVASDIVEFPCNSSSIRAAYAKAHPEPATLACGHPLSAKVLVIYDHPGGPPGNRWGCSICAGKVKGDNDAKR